MGGAVYTPDAGGASTFIGLTDTPASYSGKARNIARVNSGETGMEFAEVFYGESPDFINVEQARSDIRSTTRAGYETFDSQPGIQTLLDTVGSYKTLYFPPNAIFNLNGKMITTMSTRQHLVSLGHCTLQDGGIALGGWDTGAGAWSRVQGFRIIGATPYGIDVKRGFCNLSQLHIQDKTSAGINQADTNGIYTTVIDTTIGSCAKGIYFNMDNGDEGDSGDIFLNSLKILACGIGIHAVRVGGLNMVGSKLQNCTSGGVLIETDNNNGPLWGNYIANCTFENNTNYDMKFNSLGGTWIPQRWEIVGGEVPILILEKCDQVTFVGVLFPADAQSNGITIHPTATNVQFLGCPGAAAAIVDFVGMGTSYIAVGHDNNLGAHIKSGGRVKLIDSTGERYL